MTSMSGMVRKSNNGVTFVLRPIARARCDSRDMKQTNKTKATLFIFPKISMIAARIICSRSVSTRLKAIPALVLVISFAAGVVANTNADRHGTNLHVVPSPFISNSSLDAAAAIADNDIWAVGSVGAGSGAFQTLAEHFDGTTWSVVPTPSGNAAFFGVAGATSNDVWAVGSVNPFLSSENTLIEHWNGTNWSAVSSPRLRREPSHRGDGAGVE